MVARPVMVAWKARARGALAASTLAVALAGCGDGSGARGTPERPAARAPADAPNVVLVSIDSLRADHVSAYGYERETTPFLDELAREGVRFATAVSTTSWTLPSHAALFTGLQDSVHGLVDNGLRLAEGHRTLAELLADAGYETAGFYGGPYLHPTFGVGQGFATYVNCMADAAERTEAGDVRASAMQHVAPSHADVTGPRTRAAIAAWADARADASAPYFLFVHLWDVHYDFLAPPEYVERFDPDYTGSIDGRLMSNPAIHRGMDARDLAHVVALYDAEIRFTDDVLRGIVDDLDARGMMENTLVVVTADHGEEFFEHGRKGHNKTLFDEVLRIPLVFRWPRGGFEAGAVVPTQVRLLDVPATIAALVGVAPGIMQGRDLSGALRGGTLEEEPALSELLIDGGEQRALRTERRKLLEGARGSTAYVYDLESDPGELRPAKEGSAAEADRVALELALERALARCVELRELLGAGAEELDVDEELAEQLRALGYLGEDE